MMELHSTPQLRAKRLTRVGGRRPKVIDTDRACAYRGCETLLSRYNLSEHCYGHRPRRFPRLRGKPSG